MLKAAKDFAVGARVGKVQHEGEQAGDCVFVFPMTADIAKGLGFTGDRYGLLIGYMPRDSAMLDKVEAGEFPGLSMGGNAVRESRWPREAQPTLGSEPQGVQPRAASCPGGCSHRHREVH
jgi:hypothetical protein